VSTTALTTTECELLHLHSYRATPLPLVHGASSSAANILVAIPCLGIPQIIIPFRENTLSNRRMLEPHVKELGCLRWGTWFYCTRLTLYLVLYPNESQFQFGIRMRVKSWAIICFLNNFDLTFSFFLLLLS